MSIVSISPTSVQVSPEGGGADRLDKYASKVSDRTSQGSPNGLKNQKNPTGKASPAGEDFFKGSLRRYRQTLRDLMSRSKNRVTTLERLRKCGHTRVSENVNLMKKGYDPAYFQGIATCGSVWACPVCSAKIQAGRQAELVGAASAHEARGGTLGLVTLTVRHNSKTTLSQEFDGVSAGWKAIITGEAWMKDKEKFGIDGYVRAVEATHGKNGWHLHLHILWFFDGSNTDLELGAFFARLQARWIKGVTKTGLKAPLDRAQDFRMMKTESENMAKYLAKATAVPGIASEVVMSTSKIHAKQGNRSPWEILETAVLGDESSAKLWQEWEIVTKGRRQLTWMRGMKKRLLVSEIEDEDLAKSEETDEKVLEALFVFDSFIWDYFAQTIGAKVRILEFADLYGTDGLSDKIDDILTNGLSENSLK